MRSLRRALEQAGFAVERLEGINGTIGFRWRVWELSYWLFARGLIGLTAGHASDIRYIQFGFRATVKLERAAAALETAPHS